MLDPDFELREDGTGVAEDWLAWDINEWDSFSLEEALRIREAAVEEPVEVVVISVGKERVEEALRGALAKGADRAVRVWDLALEDADVLAVARVLAAAVARESPALVLCGVQSSDNGAAAVGVAVAGYLDLPRVAVVTRLEWDPASATAKVERELEGGLVEVVRVRAPALLTIQTGINEPRYATLRAIRQGREKPLEVLGLDDLGLDQGHVADARGARVLAVERPAHAGAAEMLTGSPAQMAARILDIVRERMPR